MVDGLHAPVMTSWADGLGGCRVIQNQSAVLKDMTALDETRLGLARRASHIARPAGL